LTLLIYSLLFNFLVHFLIVKSMGFTKKVTNKVYQQPLWHTWEAWPVLACCDMHTECAVR